MPRPPLPTVGGNLDTWGTLNNAVLTDLQTTADEDALVQRVTKFVALYTYGGETVNSGGTTNTTMFANFLYAMPFATGPDGILASNININVVGAAAGNARLGIYQSKAVPPYFPDARLIDLGTVSVSTTGTKTIAFTAVRYTGDAPSRLIWLVLLTNVAPIVRGFIDEATHLGTIADGYPACSAVSGYTYGALPASFPATPSVHNESPQIWLTAA